MELRTDSLPRLGVALIWCFTLATATAQDFGGPPPFGGRGFGPGGPGGPGGRLKILKEFDKDGDGFLNLEERKAARASLATRPRRGGRGFGPGPGGPGGPGFGPPGFGPPGFDRGGNQAPPQPGPKLKPSDVKSYGSEPLYDLQTLRTLFLEFDDQDWERELGDFYHTDVEVPAKLTVDGKVYRDVGVSFRGMSSYSSVGEGRKRSLDVSLNFMHDEQRLGGYRSLNLLNSNADPSFMRTALYHYIARQYMAAPKVNWVRVVINGESWGIYVNAQQINSDLTKEWFDSTKGARWKVTGSPGGRGGLTYLGADVAAYKPIYDIKSKDDPKAWADLIHLCDVLSHTSADRLEKALEPILDVDAALRFLALDKAAINNDGFWVRASDYSLYQDPKGQFHVIPWDANETFREPERMGRRGGGDVMTDGVDVDPFAGSNDTNKALLSKLLAVPSLRARYLAYVGDIAERWFDWNKIGPLIQQFQALIAADVKADTRKIFSTDAFTKSLTVDGFEPGFGPTAPPNLSLKSFFEQRRAYLLNYPGIKKTPARVVAQR